MVKGTVRFCQYHEYYVEGETEADCIKQAKDEFYDDMRRPVAQTWYDEIDTDDLEEDEDDFEDDEFYSDMRAPPYSPNII